MKKLAFIIMSLLLVSFSCERKADNSTESSSKETKEDKIKTEITVLNDSVTKAWDMMITSDDQKFKDIKRLLDEISYTSDYDAVLHADLVKELDAVKAKRFDETINLDQMDSYDIATDAYILKVYQLKSKSKEIASHPLADELVQDINKANAAETVAAYRLRYDRAAKKYNEYLRKNRKKLEKLGEPYASMKEKAVVMK